MKQVFDNIYQIDIELPGSPLRAIHCFVIKGERRHLLVDTAFNLDACEQALKAGLEELDISLDDTDLFITHLHVDHSGLLSRLYHAGMTVYVSAVDRAYIDGFQRPEYWDWVRMSDVWGGVPPEYVLDVTQHVAYRCRPSHEIPMREIAPGDWLDYGGYALQVVDLAGHTPGQVGLWHAASGSLFSGDHILGRVTPNITTWNLDRDFVGTYCENLRRVQQMPVQRLFSAHGTLVKDINGRIDELLEHHVLRTDRIYELARRHAPATAYDIAVEMEWSTGKHYAALPPQQKWFACTETLAHLQHLLAQGRLTVEPTDDRVRRYRPAE